MTPTKVEGRKAQVVMGEPKIELPGGLNRVFAGQQPRRSYLELLPASG